MYYRGKYTYRNPQFVDLRYALDARLLKNRWLVGEIHAGIVVQTDRGRQYLVELTNGRQATAQAFANAHANLNEIASGYQVRIIQKSKHPGVYRGVVDRRLTAAAQNRLIQAVNEFVDEAQ